MNPLILDRPEAPVPDLRPRRVRHELRAREVAVAEVRRISPNFARITFAGDSLADFASLSFDDHVKFIFADPRGETVRRDYTPRRYDPAARTLDLEFALHGHGAASGWARRAQPGQPAVIGGPRGSMVIPGDYDWHLLIGDATALPAIHNRLEELPAGRRAIAIVQVEPADRRRFDTAADVDLHWVGGGAELLAAARALRLPPGTGYTWAGGESTAMRALREILVAEKSLDPRHVKVAAYWKQGATDFHERLEG